LRADGDKEKKMTSKHVCMGSLAVVVAAALLAAGRGGASKAQQEMAGTAEVGIDHFRFGPGTLRVRVGTTVTWTNRDDTPHTVVSTDGLYKSKVLDTDEKFSFTFSNTGTFPYFCSLHPKMTGKVVVQ
jgi:plastocyanin